MLWFCHSLEWRLPVTRPAPLREVLTVIQAGLSGSVGCHVFSFAALGCLVVRCYRPHRKGRLFCLTRCALPRRRHLAAPSLTPCTHFGGWRRFPALRAVDHCARLFLCSMLRKRMRKVPRFCCHLRGEADTAQLCAGGDQVRAVIGSSWFLLCLRQSPLGSSASISSRCRNQGSPIKSNLTISPYSCFWWSWGESNPRPARTYFSFWQRFGCPRSCSLRADESPSVFTFLMRSLFNEPIRGDRRSAHPVAAFCCDT